MGSCLGVLLKLPHSEKYFASFWIRNEILPFSSVYTETFHAVFKSCLFQNRFHSMPVTKTFQCKRKAKTARFRIVFIWKRYSVNGALLTTGSVSIASPSKKSILRKNSGFDCEYHHLQLEWYLIWDESSCISEDETMLQLVRTRIH